MFDLIKFIIIMRHIGTVYLTVRMSYLPVFAETENYVRIIF